jgi:hypothetical protein
MLASDSFASMVPPSAQVLNSIHSKANLGEMDCERDIFVPEGQLVAKQELAFFLIGSMHEYLSIQEAHVRQCLALITAEHAKSPLLKLRACWLLEKLASNDSIAVKGSPLVRQTFEAVAELFA